MFQKISILLIALFLLLATTVRADVSLPYGNEKGKVAFVNQNSDPGIEEPLPLGPLSFKVTSKSFYVADTMGGKILIADKEKGFSEEIVVTATPSEMLFDDIAVELAADGQPSSFWLIDALSNSIINVGKDGKTIKKIATAEFVQPFRIEVSSSGLIYVADKGARKIFIFSPEAKLLQEIPWEWSGMALSPDADILYRLCYAAEDNTTVLVSVDKDGKITSEKALSLGEHFNPELWWIDEEKQECVITYATSQDYERKLIIARVGFDGSVRGKKEFIPPFAMNRFIEHFGDEVWVGSADFDKAPEGSFKLIKFEMP